MRSVSPIYARLRNARRISYVIRAYPREAAIAEKLNAMVVLDIRNSRMKDFYDIGFMANTWNFEMTTLRYAFHASFERRGVGTPQDVPFALTEEFLGDPQKTRQWNALVSRLYPGSASPSLEEIGILIRALRLPCILSVSAAESTAHYRTPGLHWSEQQMAIPDAPASW